MKPVIRAVLKMSNELTKPKISGDKVNSRNSESLTLIRRHLDKL